MRRWTLILALAASLAGVCPVLASNNPVGVYHPPVLLQPDLTISDVQPYYLYTLKGPKLIPDTIWVKVTNQGNAAASNFGMMFEWDFGYSYEIEYFWFAYSLGAGQSAWVQANANGYNLWASGHQFRLYVDYTGSVAESNESNNVYDYP